MITEILSLCHQSPGTVLCWMPVHFTCTINRFLAAGQGPALQSIQEPVLTKFHYSQGCPVQMKTWLLWSWRLDSTISTFGKRAQRHGRSCRQGFQKQLIIALQFSQNKMQRQILWCFLQFPTSLSLLSAWKANMFYWVLWACEGLWRNLPEWVLREFLLQLLLEGLNPVSTVTVSLRQTKHPPASFPARPY